MGQGEEEPELRAAGDERMSQAGVVAHERFGLGRGEQRRQSVLPTELRGIWAPEG